MFLIIFGCVGSSLLLGLSLVVAAWSYSSRGERASHGGVFSCPGAQVLEWAGFSSCNTWSHGLQNAGSVVAVHGHSCSFHSLMKTFKNMF